MHGTDNYRGDGQSLKRSLQKYRTLFHESAAFIWVLDTEGVVLELNKTAAASLKRPTTDIHKQRIWETPWFDGNDEAKLELWAAMLRGETANSVSSSTTIHINDELAPFDYELTPIIDPLGNVTAFMFEGWPTDHLHHQIERLESQNERLEEFASVVSHDLRSPLSVAQGYLELVMDDLDREELDCIADAHARMEQILDDILELARQGRDIGQPQPVSIESIVKNAWQNVQTTDNASLIVWSTGTIEADPTRLTEAFENLFRNAIEHGNSNDVTVHVGRNETGLYIEDDGPGIPDEIQEQVFDAGFSTEANGTGFGLPIVEEIITAHGWDITVANNDDGGARFEISGVEIR